MPSRKRNKSVEEDQKAVFFDSLHSINLPVNRFFEPLRITRISQNKKKRQISLNFRLPGEPRWYNVYLLLNGSKKDMHYQLSPGRYKFVFTPSGENDVAELYYTTGAQRSEMISKQL